MTVNGMDWLPVHGERMIGTDCGSGFPENRPERGSLACLRLEDMREFYTE